MIVQAGSTDVTTYFHLRLAADGTDATGLTISNVDMQYTRSGVAPTAKVDAVALAATDTAHTDNRGIEIDATDQPGLYRFDWPDAAFAAGVREVLLTIKVATAFTETLRVELVGYNPADGVRLGLTALPNAAAEAAGGLYTRGTGAGQINQAANGMIDTNPVRLNNVSQSLLDLKDFADDGYDPSTNKVQGVVLTDTVTTYTGNTPQTGDSFARLGAPAGASVSADIAAIEAQTDDIGVAGAGLTAVPWNPAWDAEVQSEVDDALVAQRLDELVNADSDIDGAAPPTVGSVFHELMSKTAGSFTFDQTTDSLEAVRDNMGTPQTGDSFARIGATGSGLTSLASQASVDVIDGNVDAILVDTNELQTDWVDGGRLDLILDARASQTSVDDLPTNAELAASQAAADDATLAAIAAVDAKIDIIDTNVDAILVDTAEIGAAGAGLTAVPWNATWDAEVQSEVDDALVARNLDKLILVSGTADSGSTTAMVDAARTEADADYWKGRMILFTSGNIAGQCAIITDFVPGTDTLTFAPALTQAVATQNYVILPNISVWDDVLAEHLGSGSTGAALNAAGSAGDPWNTALPGAYGAGTAGKIVGDNINATISSRATQTSVDDLPTNAELATALDPIPTAAENADAVWDEPIAGHLSAGSTGEALNNAGAAGTPPTVGEIADAVWDEDATGHQTQGTFGQAIGDPVADTNTIFKAVVTDAAGANVAADIIAVKAETAAILTDTAEIGTAGAGLTNINLPDQTMNITGNITGNLSGSVGSVTGLTASNLDATVSSRASQTSVDDIPTNAELATALASADDAVLAAIAALNNLSQANIRTAVGLASANLDTQLGDLPTNAEAAALAAAADDAVLAAIAALNNLSAAQVNAEVLDVLNVDTFAQPGQGTPAATTTIRLMLAYLYKFARNQVTQTSSQFSVYNDDAATIDQKATFADDGTTATRGEITTGP